MKLMTIAVSAELTNHDSQLPNQSAQGSIVTPEDRKTRKERFARRGIRLTRSLPPSPVSRVIANQVLRSSTAGAACQVRCRPEFLGKLWIVVEQGAEAVFWLQWILKSGLVRAELLAIASEASQRHLLGLSTNRKTKSFFVNRKSYFANGA